jgi:glycosyltransferase involved in cell wall biosynthesis
MKVLMITGDDRFLVPGTEAHQRFLLQKGQVDELKVVVWSPRHPLALFSILGQALSHRFDVVTAQDPVWRGALALLAARLGGAKLQVQLHGDLRYVRSFSRTLLKIVLWHADAIRAVSEHIRAQAEEVGVRVFVDVLPVFVDAEAIRSAPAADVKKEFPRFGKTVLFAGRLEAEKNCAEALRVFAEVAREFPGAGLIVAGEGSERPMLEAMSRDLGLSQKVVFAGYRTDALSLYKAVDCLLVTSLHESWGAAIVEALAAGCAVVAPDVGVASEAGATVVSRPELGAAVIGILRSGARGRLRFALPTRQEWARQWKETLIHSWK